MIPNTPEDATNPHGANGNRVRARVGSDVAPKQDTRGVVPADEQLFLADGFGAELLRLRKAAGLSQVRASGLSGLSSYHISRLERGLRRPSVPGVKALARVLAPEGKVKAVEQRLASLAGESLREGAERYKYRAETRNRRKALADLEQHVRKLNRTIRRQEAAGQIVSGALRKLANGSQAVADRLRLELTLFKEPEGIEGFTPSPVHPDVIPRRARRDEILAWLADQRRER